jgi:hypothetical protein
VSIFYVLPARPQVGACVAKLLRDLLPGLACDHACWTDLADTLVTALAPPSDVFIVYGEELPAGPDVEQALMDGFGAEPGDEVIEVQRGDKPGTLVSRRWQVAPVSQN